MVHQPIFVAEADLRPLVVALVSVGWIIRPVLLEGAGGQLYSCVFFVLLLIWI
jgi:hypothetical protein